MSMIQREQAGAMCLHASWKYSGTAGYWPTWRQQNRIMCIIGQYVGVSVS